MSGSSNPANDSGSPNEKYASFDRKVFVYGLPEGATEKSVQIHFGKKRNGGGDIESVTCLPGGKATVVFEDPRAADEVCKTKQTFQEKVLEVELVKIEATKAKPNVEESSEKNQSRTVLVTGLPEGTTENSVQIHFGKKRNGGGDIESVTCLPGGKATLVFEDPRVAEGVVKTEQTFKGKVLEVKMMKIEATEAKPSDEELRNEDSLGKTQSRTVLVSGLPEGATENSVQIHFGKKRNGGGDIESVTCLPGGKATVVFEDPRVAEEVVKTEQKFQGKVLEVKMMKTEATEAKPSVEELTNEESAGKTGVRTVLVSGLPEGATENGVHIHFQKKKNGGGEVEKVNLLAEGKAMVVFEDPEVAQKVVDTIQKFQGKVVDVKLDESETLTNDETPGKTEISKLKIGTILVSGLPDGATENGVHIHFQKKKNGGGEIIEVKLLPENNEASVSFEDIEVAKRVVNQEQKFKGKVLVVKLQNTETEPNIEKSKGEESVEKRTILVTGLPKGATENNIQIHFGKKKNGGGDIEKVVILPEGNTALVVFEDPEVAKTVVTTPQNMKGKVLTVSFLKSSPEVKTVPEVATPAVGTPETERTTEVERRMPEDRRPEGEPEDRRPEGEPEDRRPEGEPEDRRPQGGPEHGRPKGQPEESHKREDRAIAANTQSVDQVFPLVTATVNPMLLSTASQHFWSDLLNFIQKACGVQCQSSVYGVLLSGSLSQVTNAGELLALRWRKHCQPPHHHNVNQGNTTSNHGGSTFNQGSTSFNQGSTSFNQCDTTNRYGTTNPIGASIGGEFRSSEQAYDIRPENYHQNPNYSLHLRNQQSGWNREGQGLNETERKGDNSVTGEFDPYSDASCNHSYSNLDDAKHGKPPGLTQNVANRQPFETQLNSHSNYIHGSPSSTFIERGRVSEGKTDPLGAGPSRSIDSTRDLEPSGDGQTATDTTRTENVTPKVDGTSPPNKPDLNAKLSSSPDETRNLQRSGDRKTTTDTTTRTENPLPKVVGASPPDKSDLNAKQSSSSGETRNPQAFVDNPETTLNPTNDAQNITTSSNQFVSPSNNTADPPKEKPLSSPNSSIVTSNNQGGLLLNDQSGHLGEKQSTSPNSTKTTANLQPPADNQKHTSINPATGPENKTTSSNQVASPSNDTAETPKEKSLSSPNGSTTTHKAENRTMSNLTTGPEDFTTSNKQSGSLLNDNKDLPGEKPSTSPNATTTRATATQPLADNQNGTSTNLPTGPEKVATSNTQNEVLSKNRPESLTDKPSSLPDSTTNPQQPVENQQGTILNTTATGLQNSTKWSNPAESSSNDELNTLTEKSPSLSSDSTINPQQPGNNQQHTDASNGGSENPASSSDKPGSLLNNSLVENPPSSPDCTTSPQPSDNDQNGTTSNTATEPNSTTSNNQTERERPDSHTGKPSIPTGKTPECQPEDDQQQTTPGKVSEQQTSTPESLKNVNEIFPDKSPDSKSSVKPCSLEENNLNSEDKPQKRTPIPVPRKNKPSGIAAKFSSPSAKARQDTPSPTKMNNNSSSDKPTATNTKDNKVDKDDTKRNSKNSITSNSETAEESGIHSNKKGDEVDTFSNIQSENTSHKIELDNLDELD